MADRATRLLFSAGLADWEGFRYRLCRRICGGGLSSSSEFCGAAQVPNQRTTTEDGDEGEEDKKDAEAGFHGGFLMAGWVASQ